MLDDFCGNFAKDVLCLFRLKQIKIKCDLSEILLGQA
jgi:hypothetical protein